MDKIEVKGRSAGITTINVDEDSVLNAETIEVGEAANVETLDVPKIDKKKNASKKKEHQNLVKQRKIKRQIKKYNRLKRQHRL